MKIFKQLINLRNTVNRFIPAENRLNIYFSIFVVLIFVFFANISITNISRSNIKSASESAYSLINQTARNIDIIYSNIDKTATSMSTDMILAELLIKYNNANDTERVKIQNDVSTIIINYMAIERDISDILVYNDKNVFYSNLGLSKDFFNIYPIKDFNESGKDSMWTDMYLNNQYLLQDVSEGTVTLLKSIYQIKELKKAGTLVINIPESHLINLLDGVNMAYSGQIYIIGKTGRVIVNPKNKGRYGSVLKVKYLSEILANDKGYFTDDSASDDVLVHYCSIPRTEWKIVGLTNVSNITREHTYAIGSIVAVMGLCLILISVISAVVNAKTSSLLKKLVHEKTEQLEQTILNLKNTQEQLIESEKMAYLGNLVTGVAHEINTPIGIGLTTSTFLNLKSKEILTKLESNDIKKRELDVFVNLIDESSNILTSCLKKASDLIKNFKKISVDQYYEELTEIDIVEFIKYLVNNLKYTMQKTNINVSVTSADNIPISLNTYAGQFSQLITNLLMNSIIHGYDYAENGEIDIEVSCYEKSCVIVYADKGKGMDKEASKRIFEPFYTTKRGSGRSGLGMYIVYNIIVNSFNGTITCFSEPGKGTKFIISIPFVNDMQKKS